MSMVAVASSFRFIGSKDQELIADLLGRSPRRAARGSPYHTVGSPRFAEPPPTAAFPPLANIAADPQARFRGLAIRLLPKVGKDRRKWSACLLQFSRTRSTEGPRVGPSPLRELKQTRHQCALRDGSPWKKLQKILIRHVSKSSRAAINRINKPRPGAEAFPMTNRFYRAYSTVAAQPAPPLSSLCSSRQELRHLFRDFLRCARERLQQRGGLRHHSLESRIERWRRRIAARRGRRLNRSAVLTGIRSMRSSAGEVTRRRTLVTWCNRFFAHILGSDFLARSPPRQRALPQLSARRAQSLPGRLRRTARRRGARRNCLCCDPKIFQSIFLGRLTLTDSGDKAFDSLALRGYLTIMQLALVALPPVHFIAPGFSAGPPDKLDIRAIGGQPEIRIEKEPAPPVAGTRYRLQIEASSDLKTWSPEGELLPGADTAFRLGVSGAGPIQVFRLRPEIEDAGHACRRR